MRWLASLLALCCLTACGSMNESAPVGVGTAKNAGTQVWLIPAPAGDMMRLAQQPELWPQTQQRVDVVSIYMLSAYHHDGYECGNPCGPNTYHNLLNAVPGGMYKWLSDHFALAFEGASVKPLNCTNEGMVRQIETTTRAIDNIVKSGGRLSYITMDEAFMSGQRDSVFGIQSCGLSAEGVAQLQRRYNDGIHATHPEVQIGFIEPYPELSPDEIMSAMLELENAGVPVPYFHLDFDLARGSREKRDWKSDVRRIREFFAARRVPFAVIIAGFNGTSDEAYMTDAIVMMRAVYQTVGVTEHTVMQSWAEDPPGDITSVKHVPSTVPETQRGTHTWLVLQVLKFMDITPVG